MSADDWEEPSWSEGRSADLARRVRMAERATVIRMLEDEAMKHPANMDKIDRLGRRLCEIEDAIGLRREKGE